MPICSSCGRESDGDFAFCPYCAAPLTAHEGSREQRKTVTVLFCDVTGSTALGESTDPEALRTLLARYFERMKGIIEAHGGTVEKFIGDAVMAVFGVPRVHEDDALRACRAAVEMRDALPELGLQARIGLNTGEVVTGTEERLATGDAVNVAARLEQAAQPGEILIGSDTLELVRDTVETEPVEPLELKGKAEPVPAFRLIAVSGELIRRDEAPMVGRERQRRLLEDAFAAVREEKSCHLFTILGVAGVGKSRLTHEFLKDVEARVVRGRCISYGEGITYWPAVEVLTQLGVRPEEPAAAAAIRSVLEETDEPTTPDEIAWAVRKTLEQAAAKGPLVCVFDDLHWAEQALLDLVEHMADWSRDASILLLCIARPELLDRRQGWAGGKLNATTVLLEPLSAAETDELIEGIAPVDDKLRGRIREAAEGNPLFVEEMLAMVREAGNGEVSVPPTIQALLAARLDQLEGSERALLECGAVEGKVFHRGAVEALTPEDQQVPRRLMGLVRKELLRPDKSLFRGDDAFRFRHLLIRDAAYDALPKASRAELHARYADWLEEHGADLVELDELVGYHLEQASRYRQELGLPEDSELDAAARRRLTAAGRRALLRGDQVAAVNLVERAHALANGERDLMLEQDVMEARFQSGDLAGAAEWARSLAARAASSGDRVAELFARLWEGKTRLHLDPQGAADNLAALIDEALSPFEHAGDAAALFLLHSCRAEIAHVHGQTDVERDAAEQAVLQVRRLGFRHAEVGLLPLGAGSRGLGTTPVADLLAWLGEQEAAGMRHTSLRLSRARALLMTGRFEEARAIHIDLSRELVERGAAVQLALLRTHGDTELELMAGNPAAAAAAGEQGCAILEDIGERSWLSTGVAKLGEAYYRLGRFDDAASAAERSAELGSSDDVVTQMVSRQVKAKVLARRGSFEEAERLARETITLWEGTDMIKYGGDAYSDLAEVLALAGAGEAAVEALERALSLYERKGVVPLVERVRARREELLLQLER